MPIALHGFAVSNYYNKVKLVLLEKGLDFTEVYTGTGSTDAQVLAASPLAKIPFMQLEDGRSLCESEAIVEYLEDAFPQVPLLPADPFRRAKVRELVTFIDWHLEMTARQLYGMAFFGQAALSESNQARIRRELEARIRALRQLASFDPYLAGSDFTLADCAGWVSLPLVSMASKAVYGEDLLLAGGLDIKSWMALVGARPSAQKVAADRKAATQKR